MTCPECHKVIPDGLSWCPSCGIAFRSPNPGGSMLRIAVALFSVVFLLACGSEATPPDDQVVALHEVCTVRIQPDGTIVCTCVPADPEAL